MRIGVVALSLICGATAAGAAAPPSALPPSLAAAARAYDAAQVKGDGRLLRRLLADDYLLVNSGGGVQTKEQFIADLTAPGYELNPYVVRRPIERIWPGGAVTGGVVRLTGQEGEKAFDACLRFADVWALRARRWQVIYTHVSREDAASCK